MTSNMKPHSNSTNRKRQNSAPSTIVVAIVLMLFGPLAMMVLAGCNAGDKDSRPSTANNDQPGPSEDQQNVPETFCQSKKDFPIVFSYLWRGLVC
ncbi:MAG: hypothetical protein AAFN77_23760, partial [Planctomycetota bacterium]